MIRLTHGANSYYFEYFDNETIEDILSTLTKKYGFKDDNELGIYQNGLRLPNHQKITDLLNKNDLKINGNLVSEKKNIQEEVKSEPAPINYLEEFRLMGFKESDEKINQFLRKYNFDIKEVIAQLLIERRKSRK